MPLYIHFAASISCQDRFKKDFYKKLKKIDADSIVQAPYYKDYFKGSQLRRLSPILKAGMSLALDCSKNTTKPFDAIILGTGLGCLTDTEKFLQNIKNKTGDLLSPTAFIQSTHNTISGQVSILLNNKGYNTTHSQNNLSFEMSLIDAMSEFNEGKEQALVGGIDEDHPFMKVLNEELKIYSGMASFCASFFVVQKQKNSCKIAIKSVYTDFSNIPTEKFITQVFEKEALGINQIDLVLHSNSNNPIIKEHANSLNYLNFTGYNLSASAFATHIAYDFLEHSNCKTVLIVNDLCVNKGLILITKND